MMYQCLVLSMFDPGASPADPLRTLSPGASPPRAERAARSLASVTGAPTTCSATESLDDRPHDPREEEVDPIEIEPEHQRREDHHDRRRPHLAPVRPGDPAELAPHLDQKPPPPAKPASNLVGRLFQAVQGYHF